VSNLSILQQNIAHGFSASPHAHQAFFRALNLCDGTLRSEAFANEVLHLTGFMDFALPLASSGHHLGAVPDGLLAFILTRHWHYRFPEAKS
jgi:hypothetical protein